MERGRGREGKKAWTKIEKKKIARHVSAFDQICPENLPSCPIFQSFLESVAEGVQ